MKHPRIVWSLAVVAGLSASAGCKVTNCNESDASICNDDDFDFDSSVGEDDDDAATGSRDGGADASTSADGAVDADGSVDDASADADTGDAALPSSYSVEEFCAAQFKNALDWRYAFDDVCVAPSANERDDWAYFLQTVFLLSDGDPIGDCITRVENLVERGTVTYHEESAPACAKAFNDQFAPVPDSFPTTGIDIGTYEGSIGHGLAVIAQIPACREALEGSVGRDQTCTESPECTSGLRCMAAPGGGLTCQPALDRGNCVRNSDCIDTYRCVGATGTTRTCVSVDDLPIAGSCSSSIECAEGYVCSGENRCTTATAYSICGA